MTLQEENEKMSEQVRRFDFFAHLNDGFAELDYHESDEGSYVRNEDHEREVRHAIAAGIRMQDKCDALRAEVEALRAVLIRSLPIVEAHAGESHMLEGFRPTRNKWDELVEEIHAAIAAKEA